MFLFLSGLGLAYHLHRHPVHDLKSWLHFMGQRFSRIYVVFLPFTLIYALLDDWGVAVVASDLNIPEGAVIKAKAMIYNEEDVTGGTDK